MEEVVHQLKTWPKLFNDVLSGKKLFEVRKNDRNFKVGDTIVLLEWDPDTKEYTDKHDRKYVAVITYILKGGKFGIKKGYCVLGFG